MAITPCLNHLQNWIIWSHETVARCWNGRILRQNESRILRKEWNSFVCTLLERRPLSHVPYRLIWRQSRAIRKLVSAAT